MEAQVPHFPGMTNLKHQLDLTYNYHGNTPLGISREAKIEQGEKNTLKVDGTIPQDGVPEWTERTK